MLVGPSVLALISPGSIVTPSLAMPTARRSVRWMAPTWLFDPRRAVSAAASRRSTTSTDSCPSAPANRVNAAVVVGPIVRALSSAGSTVAPVRTSSCCTFARRDLLSAQNRCSSSRFIAVTVVSSSWPLVDRPARCWKARIASTACGATALRAAPGRRSLRNAVLTVSSSAVAPVGMVICMAGMAMLAFLDAGGVVATASSSAVASGRGRARPSGSSCRPSGAARPCTRSRCGTGPPTAGTRT